MRWLDTDPGPCDICGVAHCACGGDEMSVVQLPQRDAAVVGMDLAPSFGDGTDDRPFTTATFRGSRKRRGSSSRP